MRPLSQSVHRLLVALGKPAGVLGGDPAYRIRRTKGALAGCPVQERASAATTQRLEHAAFGGTTATGRMERTHGIGGRLIRGLSKDGAGLGAGGEQGSRLPPERIRRAGRQDRAPGPEGSSDALAAQ